MRVSTPQDNLSKGLSIVSRAVGSRSNLPVLSNVLIATDNGRLRLAATNLNDLGIVSWVAASVEEDGAITVPARTLNDLVNTLSPERVDLEVAVRTNTLNLNCGAMTAQIKGIDAQEFPIMPEPTDEDQYLPVPAQLLRETIKMVAFAAARQDSRPVLTGVLMEYDGQSLTMAAADGFRLAVREMPLAAESSENFSLVVPAKTLSELERIGANEDEDVYIVLPKDRSQQVLFHMNNVDVSTQLLGEEFPNFRQIVPQETTTRVILDTASLLQACKRADIFAREANHTIQVHIQPQEGMAGVVRVSATSAETGENEGFLDATIEGDDLSISFNVRYVIDVLNVIQSESVEILTSRPDKPGIIRPLGDSTYTYVIMPMYTGR
ncbi:MAG: DNA polymerase III subunit beta [Chloroflexi bacterium]|nr:DNA polymerase III subunit beta [Chloroflexota bacterium]